MIAKHPSWAPATARDPAPLPPGDPGHPIPFVLTPAERDIAALATVELDRARRAANRRDLLTPLHRHPHGT